MIKNGYPYFLSSESKHRNQEYGPVAAQELQQWALENRIQPTTEVRQRGYLSMGPNAPQGLGRISGPLENVPATFFCSTRLLPESYTQSAKRLAGTASGGEDGRLFNNVLRETL